MRTSRSPSIVFALLVAAAAGCGERPREKKLEVPVPVIAETATTRAVIDYVETVGRVEAQSVSNVGSQLPGRLVLMTREVGDLVPGRTGDPAKDPLSLLAKLDTDALEAQLGRLNAEIKLAEVNLPALKTEWQRHETLLKQGSGTEQRRDQAKAVYDAALAKAEAVKAARKEVLVQIEQSSIYAPMDAVVVKKFANVGDVISPVFSPQLYQLECIRDLKINAIVPERDVPDVKARKKAEITFDALPGRAFTGAIHTLIPSGDPISHSFTAEIRFRNHTKDGPLPAALPKGLSPEDLLMKPGMFARVRIVKYEKSNAVVVPKRCVVEEGDRSFVYLIGPARPAKKTEVKTGVVMGLLAEITEGLAAGQRVVGRGIENVTEGQPVRVIREGGATADAARPPAVTSGGQ